MSNIEQNTAGLQEILDMVNDLPEAGESENGQDGFMYEPFYIDCVFSQDGDIYTAVATSETPSQEEVDAAFAKKRPIYLRNEATGIQITNVARIPTISGGYAYAFIIISGNTTSSILFVDGGFYNTYFVAQEKIAVVSNENEVQDGKITIVV